MRLIDADALEQSCKEIIADDWNKRTSPESWTDAYEEFLDEVERSPTVDIETEVAREIFAEIERLLDKYSTAQCFQGDVFVQRYFEYGLEDAITELENKYIGGVGE